MSNLFKNNSYHILSLDTSAMQKDILKRSKEINKRLMVDDLPEYDSDLDIFTDFRSEDSVKEAIHKLTKPKKRIKEYFFWFQIIDSVDEQALGLLRTKDYLDAIRVWRNNSEKNTIKALLYKKNLAILNCLLLFKDSNKTYLKESLMLWDELIKSNKFWRSFVKYYKLHDDLHTSKEVIDAFRNEVDSCLSDVYTEISQVHNEKIYIAEYSKVFASKGGKLEKDVLSPIYGKIMKLVEELEEMGIEGTSKKISEDGVYDSDESKKVNSSVKEFRTELENLFDLGLNDDIQTKTLQDRAAKAIQSVALDLHNNLHEIDEALKLIDIASKICASTVLKDNIDHNKSILKQNLKLEEENKLCLYIPGGGTATFKSNFVEYNDVKIFYKDVIRIFYHATTSTFKKSYSFLIGTNNETISCSFSSVFSIGNGGKKDIFFQLAGICNYYIEPFLIQKFISDIFDKGKVVRIGHVVFSKDGYKLRGYTTVAWNIGGIKQEICKPIFEDGGVVLYDSSGYPFPSIPMSIENAVVIPELVPECSNRSEEINVYYDHDEYDEDGEAIEEEDYEEEEEEEEEEEDYEEEIEACKQAVRLDPDDADAHYNLGNAYRESGKYKEAIKSYKKAIRIDPDFKEAHYNLGVAYGSSDEHQESYKYQQAIESYKQAIRIDPDFKEAYNNLGLAYGKLGKHKEEFKSYKQAIRIDPDYAIAHLNLGVAYVGIDDRDSALEQYEILKNLDTERAKKLFDCC